MQSDPRKNNTFFKDENIGQYLKEYVGAVSYALNKIDYQHLENAKELLKLTVVRGGRIFVGGNGGSSAISDHLLCDFVKGTHSEKKNGLCVHSLNSSTALFTAIGNDFGYEHTFSFQLKAMNLNSNDTVILISSSGNSPNIVSAAEFALQMNASLIGMTGFTGGALFKLANVKLHVPYNNYGVIEDAHQALMHVLAQYHWLSNEK